MMLTEISLEASGDEPEAAVEEESSAPSNQWDGSPSSQGSFVETSRTESKQEIDEVNIFIEMKRTENSHRLWVRYGETGDGLVVDLNEVRMASNGFVDLGRSHDREMTHFHLEADRTPTVEEILSSKINQSWKSR
jgi:hypothetical protein